MPRWHAMLALPRRVVSVCAALQPQRSSEPPCHIEGSERDRWCRHEKAVGRLREETRALRLLTQQAVEERAKLAATSLVCSHPYCHDSL